MRVKVHPAAIVEALLAALGAFGGLAVIVLLGANWLSPRGFGLVVGALASSSVVVFGASESPFAQPRNVVLSYTSFARSSAQSLLFSCPSRGWQLGLLLRPRCWSCG